MAHLLDRQDGGSDILYEGDADVYYGRHEGVLGFDMAILETDTELSPRHCIFGYHIAIERIAADPCFGYDLVVVVVVVLYLFQPAVTCGDHLQFCHKNDIFKQLDLGWFYICRGFDALGFPYHI